MSNDVQITIGAQDQASPVVDAATKNILANWKVMRAEVRSTTAEFQLQNQTLVAGANAFRSMGSVATSAMNIFTQFETMQISLTNARNNLILAQLHYNQVLAMEGPGTNDAIAASIQLQEAQQSVTQQTQLQTLGYIGMGIEMGGMVGQMIQTIPTLERFAIKLGLIKDAQVALNTSMAASPVAALGGSGVVGGKAGKGAMIGKGLGALAGIGIAGAGVMGSQALSQSPLDTGEKLMSIGEQAGGGALTGAMIGSIVPGIGTLIGAIGGAVAGAGLGIATNYGDDISKALFGKGSDNSGKVEHVVTIKIENASDHKVSATEQSMGIEQVMSSNP